MKRIYSTEDINDLIGEAVEALRAELRSDDHYARIHAAQQILSIPISTTLSQAQELKDTFPNVLPASE